MVPLIFCSYYISYYMVLGEHTHVLNIADVSEGKLRQTVTVRS